MPSDSDRIYRVSGSYETFIEEDGSTVSYQLFSGSKLPVVQTASLQVKRSVRELRGRASRVANRFLLGTAYRSEVSENGVQSSFAPPPTRTHSTLGVNHAFVAQALSASRHEQQVLNCWISGNAPLETTAVPATGTEIYSKFNPIRTVTYKYACSASDALFSASAGAEVSSSSHTGAPRKFTINVNETGKLRNIRVWVEIVHRTGSGLFPAMDDIGIAIRSPNVRWGHAHPIRNDQFFRSWKSGSFVIPDFYDSTYILWEGVAVIDGAVFGGSYETLARARYPGWGKDRHMRTVFEDSSPYRNPRHLLGTSPMNNTNGSPNAGVDSTPTALGNDVPWMTDVNMPGPGTGPGSPPVGWLTGPGGTAGTNEFATTGSNNGAPTMQPLYPMLDSIFQKKITNAGEGSVGYGVFNTGIAWIDWYRWKGFRPGLRGTEISGTWELVLARGGPNDDAYQCKTFLRQWRIELTYDTGAKPQFIGRSRFKASSDTRNPGRPGSKQILIISGSDSGNVSSLVSMNQDYFKNEVIVDVDDAPAIGRTFGLVTTTGSLGDGDFSLFYRLSGTLGDRIGESPWWLTTNEFGMPMIPDSSSSLVPSSPQVLTAPGPRRSPVDALNPIRSVGSGHLRSQFVRTNPPRKLSELAKEFAAGGSGSPGRPATGSGNGPFVYVCDGSEGSEFFIDLPAPRVDDKYVVIGSLDGAASTLSIQFPRLEAGDRTKDRFKVVLSAAATKGDRITFKLEDLVREI